MSFIVKGEDMPESCIDCPFHDYDMIPVRYSGDLFRQLIKCRLSPEDYEGSLHLTWDEAEKERFPFCPLKEVHD